MAERQDISVGVCYCTSNHVAWHVTASAYMVASQPVTENRGCSETTKLGWGAFYILALREERRIPRKAGCDPSARCLVNEAKWIRSNFDSLLITEPWHLPWAATSPAMQHLSRCATQECWHLCQCHTWSVSLKATKEHRPEWARWSWYINQRNKNK